MACPYYIRAYSGAHHESRPFQRLPDLVRPVGKPHRDARVIDTLPEVASSRHARRREEACHDPPRDGEDHTFRLVRRSAGHGEAPAPRPPGCRRERGDPLVRSRGGAQWGNQRLDDVRHAAREAPESALYGSGYLNPEQLRRLPFREPLEPLAAPEQRSLGEL